jgi:hypothetical protein
MIEDEFLPSIHETKLPKLPNADLKVVQAKPRKHPEFLPKLHFLAYFCASRGSGKTTAIVNFIKKYDKAKSFDHIVVYSPTADKEPKYKHLVESCKYAQIELIDKFSHESFAELRLKIEKRLEEYKKYERDLALWKNFRHYKGKWEDFNDDDLLRLHDLDYEKPTSEYKNGHPTTLILFDDLMGNRDLYSSQGAKAAWMNSFFVVHRHHLVSVIFSCQAFKSNSVPKCIRQNISCMCLWRNKSPEIQKEIAKECCSFVNPEDFIDFWNHATEKNKHDFLYVDYEADEPYNIRKNFNTVLSYRPVRSKNMAQKKKKGRSNDPAKAVEIEGSTNATA